MSEAMREKIKVGEKEYTARQRRNGLWDVKVPIQGNQRQNFYASSIRELQRKVDDAIGIVNIEGTLNWFYASVFLPTIIGLEKETLKKYGWAMDTYVRPRFGRHRLEEISREDLQSFFNSLELSAGSKRQVRGKLSSVLNLAVEDGYIPRNPASSVRLPKAGKRKVVLGDYSEYRAFLDWPEPWSQVARLLLITGARIGEVMALTRSDLENGVLTIDKQRHRNEGIKATKTEDQRVISLPDAAVEEILKHAGPVFLISYENGQPPSVAYTQMQVSELMGKDSSAHTFRHIVTSLLENELEAPRRIVKSIVGHKDGDMTGRYSHSTLNQQKKWLEKHWGNISSTNDVVKDVVNHP